MSVETLPTEQETFKPDAEVVIRGTLKKLHTKEDRSYVILEKQTQFGLLPFFVKVVAPYSLEDFELGAYYEIPVLWFAPNSDSIFWRTDPDNPPRIQS